MISVLHRFFLASRFTTLRSISAYPVSVVALIELALLVDGTGGAALKELSAPLIRCIRCPRSSGLPRDSIHRRGRTDKSGPDGPAAGPAKMVFAALDLSEYNSCTAAGSGMQALICRALDRTLSGSEHTPPDGPSSAVGILRD